MRQEYIYCEPSHTTGHTWCIRRLSGIGPFPGGGVDTNSLCGRVRSPLGWDINLEVTPERNKFACKKCVEAYKELTDVT